MKTDRLIGIVTVLLGHKRISAKELSRMFEVSLRTIYRDIDHICMAGIPVRAVSGTNGGFEIMPEYRLDKSVFTYDELTEILTGLNGLNGMLHGDTLVHALAKVRTLIPEEKAREIELRSDRVIIDPSPWIGNKDAVTNLECLQSALKETRCVSFTYIDLRGNGSQRTVEPYRLVFKAGHWYLHAFCLLRNDMRLFRLSRIRELRITNRSFEPLPRPLPVLDIDTIVEQRLIRISLRVHVSILERVLEFCSFDHFTPDGEEYFVVEHPFIENEYYYDMLLSYGPRCECLSPQRVRETLKARIHEMYRRYDDEPQNVV